MEELDLKISIKQSLNRKQIMNKFIEKFPKTKLYTLMQINKYCNKKDLKIETDNCDEIEINYVCNYLEMLN